MRAVFPHTAYRWSQRRGLRGVAHGSPQMMQAHAEETLEGPFRDTEARALSASPPEPVAQAMVDVVVHLIEFVVCVPAPEVVASATQHGVQLPDDVAQFRPSSSPVGQFVDAAADPLHRLRGWSAL